MDNNLLQIFIEAAHRASLIPFASEATLYAMKSFGKDISLGVVLAIFGGLIGHSFNFLIGRWMMKLPSSPKNHQLFQKLEFYANKFGYLALVLAPLALGNIVVVAAGMLNVPIKKALPVTAAGLLIYYGRLFF